MFRALRPLLAKAPATRPLRPLGVSARNYAAQADGERRFSPVQTTSVEECVRHTTRPLTPACTR
jgi:hypothetical protein